SPLGGSCCPPLFSHHVHSPGSAAELPDAALSEPAVTRPFHPVSVDAEHTARYLPHDEVYITLSHTSSGDKAFGDFLSDEIKEREEDPEKQKLYPRIVLEDGELEMNGTEAKLSRSVSGESKITVTFNINNSIPPNFEEEVEQGQQKPNTKKCHESDIFAIREVSFQPEGDTEWKETCYTLNTDSLDWALYDHMMDFLADRGVDNTFADELMELSTAIEHQEYIKFLEDLQGFVKCN
uniref:Complement component 1 Q subcomponent-binding protein, mitochondrial n=1 Tax=Amphiprion percula TaxID=161767 RepID=A0A3P8T478_AMPPE